jgi:hypothetical protein
VTRPAIASMLFRSRKIGTLCSYFWPRRTPNSLRRSPANGADNSIPCTRAAASG